ncbi:MAG TPA: GNAT family N-acetyltransferase [Nitrososphaera sp.]|jgi:hypothetical protein
MLEPFQIENKSLIVSGKIIKTAELEQEWYDYVGEPEEIVEGLRKNSVKADIFTFWQGLPEVSAPHLTVTPRYKYYMEWDDIAVLPIKSYDYWWSKQTNSSIRGKVRKASKQGLIVRDAEFSEDFVRGMVDIFNESPIRQGKPFWHYGKDFETVKREFSRYLFREELFGAYYNDELIGFIMLAYGENFVYLGQIISKMKHRDKATNNALIAKAVEICDQKRIPYLVYARWDSYWNSGSLTDFKRYNGFQKVSLPRYYIPLTIKGEVALRLALHRGFKGVIPMIPVRVQEPLVKLRSRWYEMMLTRKHPNYNASNVGL